MVRQEVGLSRYAAFQRCCCTPKYLLRLHRNQTYIASSPFIYPNVQLSSAAAQLSVYCQLLTCAFCCRAEERFKAQEAGEDGGGGQPIEDMMDMGKMNTARIRKAVDPRIMDVKKRVRSARRKLKRDSKVQGATGAF